MNALNCREHINKCLRERENFAGCVIIRKTFIFASSAMTVKYLPVFHKIQIEICYMPHWLVQKLRKQRVSIIHMIATLSSCPCTSTPHKDVHSVPKVTRPEQIITHYKHEILVNILAKIHMHQAWVFWPKYKLTLHIQFLTIELHIQVYGLNSTTNTPSLIFMLYTLSSTGRMGGQYFVWCI